MTLLQPGDPVNIIVGEGEPKRAGRLAGPDLAAGPEIAGRAHRQPPGD
jgi:hypothetical protein